VTSSPWLTLLLIASGGYFAKAWWEDYRATREGKPPPHPLPGAHPAPARALIIAVAGSLVILAGETGGEWALGLTAEQSTMTVLFGIYTLVAAVIEEIIFRGYIVVEGRGATARWLGIFGASLVFAALHPFLWQWHDGDFSWQFTAKGWFSTGAVFVSSLWFYTVRCLAANPQRSLLPCFAAHAAKNLGVFAIKGAQGFVVGGW